MSASKDRKLRKQQIEAGTDKRTQAEAKAKAQRRKTNITYSVVAAVLVVFFAFIFTYNSTFPNRHTTAVTINGQDYSVAQLNYYYSNAYMNFYNNNYYYVMMGAAFDPQQSLADQAYSEDQSWRDYFLDAAVDNMRQIQMLNDQAQAAGFTLSAEDQAAYDEAVADMQTSWEELGYSSLKQYINLNYGKGVDEQMVKDEMYRMYVASAYSQSVIDSYEFTAREQDAYYAEHADELDVIDYMYYLVSDPETADAQAIADAVDGTDADTFTAYLEDNYDGAVPTSQSLAGGSISSTYANWLLDAARQSGDAAAIDNGDISYVVMFLGRNDNSYPLVGFRHILINAEDTDGDGEYSQAEIDAAAARANDLYEQWQAGDATEDSFAQMANEYSEDGGSNTNGGLYEDVYQGQMVSAINDWLFEDGRKAGDTTVVSNDGSYTGTHVVYFTGTADQTYAQIQADNLLRSEAYNNWMDESLTAYEAATSHLKMAGKNH